MSVTAVPIQPVKRSYIVWIWLGIIVAVLAAFLLARQSDDYWTKTQRDSGIETTPSGLKYKVLEPGTGPKATDMDVALVTYEGKLRDGTVFDKSEDPVPMPVQRVVPGFSEALKLMSRGEKLRVWIPATLGYGDKANGPIPANSPLIFDVSVSDIKSLQQFMAERQMMMGGAGGPGGMPPGADGAPPGAGGDGAPGSDAPGGDTEKPAPKGGK